MPKYLDFLRYPSTWKGLIALLGMVGITLAPEQSEAITTACITVVGAIWTFFSDADVKKAK